MNTPTTYEQLIAQKLEQLPPLKGMEEIIWQRVTDELDIDPPAEDPPTNPPNTPVGGVTAKILPWIIVLVLLVVVFINTNRPFSNSASPTAVPANVPGPAPQVTPTDGPRSSPVPQALQPSGQQGIAPVAQVSSGDTNTGALLANDSLKPNLISPVFVPGPAFFNPPGVDTSIPGITTPVKDTTNKPPVKKPPGVRGINASDYKIVPKKDSVP